MSKPKRPRDPNQLGKLVVEIATGESDEPKGAPSSKDPKAVGRGKARASKLTPERRSEIASKAARRRWATQREDDASSGHRSP